MKTLPLRDLAAALLAATALASPAASMDANQITDLPEHDVADPQAPPVEAGNLLANERFWPYRVALTREWKPAGAEKPLAAKTTGVLVRVESTGLARIDFGRHGLFAVPPDATDLVAQANAIRLGKEKKKAPNFLLAIAPRVLSTEDEKVRAVRYRELADEEMFLCVFVDPKSTEWLQIASVLATRRPTEGLLTILFPQGRIPDERMHRDLRRLGWKTAFVFDHLSEPYTQSLVAEEPAHPRLLLQTAEGRVLYAGAWSPGAVAALEEAIAVGLSPEPATPPRPDLTQTPPVPPAPPAPPKAQKSSE